jgi:uncharacterized SAM-binding protein YcdF (DUF218 family)
MKNLLATSILWFVGVCMVSANHTILVILGCADNNIQQERVNSAIEYINTTDSKIKLYVSGGVKDAIISNKETEASVMAKSFNDKNIEIVLDEKAKNTAENFAYLKLYVKTNFSEDNMPVFVITTSDYHKNRAEQIFNGILPNVTPSWNISKSKCIDCWADENNHIPNITSDVFNALRIIE